MSIASKARANFEALARNPYPGRGIVVGVDDSGQNAVQVYWIGGRSANSQNRVFVRGRLGQLFTAPADPAKVKDPSLIIYTVMRELWSSYVVSNGNQTDTAIDALMQHSTFQQAMCSREYEPDKPNFTPRITAVFSGGYNPCVEMAILRRPVWGVGCDRHFYRFDHIGAGFGYCVTTYTGDGDPLPAFQGEPYLVPLGGGIEDVADTFWSALNPETRVALAVKFIPVDSGKSVIHIINRFEQVKA